jgi:type I restriction enzyme S subunit
MTYHTVVSLGAHLSQFNGEGTVFGSINQKDLKALKVIAPSSALIERFSEVVDPLDALVKSNELETGSLTDLRDTLLPELLSGRVRVGEAESLTTDV